MQTEMEIDSKPRIICGYGRSGTTWVQDVVASSNNLRTVFEPLHPYLLKAANISPGCYYAENQSDPTLERYLARYLKFPYHSLWADYRFVRSRLVPRFSDFSSSNALKQRLSNWKRARGNYSKYRHQRRRSQRITKLIRANMMLPWLKATFDAQIVYLIRHPAAVVLSQERAPAAWDPYSNIERYKADKHLLEALDGRISSLVFRSLDRIESLTVCWCVENSVALAHAAQCDIPIIHHELLLENGPAEWRCVLDGLGLSEMPDSLLVSRPSQQSWGARATNAELVRDYSSWVSRIEPHKASKIQSILDASGMDIYDVKKAAPN